jgi:hypothetical protein
MKTQRFFWPSPVRPFGDCSVPFITPSITTEDTCITHFRTSLDAHFQTRYTRSRFRRPRRGHNDFCERGLPIFRRTATGGPPAVKLRTPFQNPSQPLSWKPNFGLYSICIIIYRYMGFRRKSWLGSVRSFMKPKREWGSDRCVLFPGM